MNSVSASTAGFLPSSREPKPPWYTTLPFWSSPIATPGMPSWLRPRSMNAVISLTRGGSRARAVRPAKLSRL